MNSGKNSMKLYCSNSTSSNRKTVTWNNMQWNISMIIKPYQIHLLNIWHCEFFLYNLSFIRRNTYICFQVYTSGSDGRPKANQNTFWSILLKPSLYLLKLMNDVVRRKRNNSHFQDTKHHSLSRYYLYFVLAYSPLPKLQYWYS